MRSGSSNDDCKSNKIISARANLCTMRKRILAERETTDDEINGCWIGRMSVICWAVVASCRYDKRVFWNREKTQRMTRSWQREAAVIKNDWACRVRAYL